jgi:hypothetical protein
MSVQIIRPRVAGQRHGNEIDVLSLPAGARPDFDRTLEKAVERFPGLLDRIVNACKVDTVVDRKGIVRKIDNSKPLFLVKRRHAEMDTENQNLLEKNAAFAAKVYKTIPEKEKVVDNGKIIVSNN